MSAKNEEIQLTEAQKDELTLIGELYRKAIYTQKSLPDVVKCFENELSKHDISICQEIIGEVIRYRKLIKNRELFARFRQWIDELYNELYNSKILPDNISITIICRRKGFESFVRKILKNYLLNISIDLRDLMAFRIVLDSVEYTEKELEDYCNIVKDFCKTFFSKKRFTLIPVNHQVNPDFDPEAKVVKNYIKYPKKNNYRTIQFSYKTLDNDVFEIQIRSLDMHMKAECGEADYFKYKNNEYAALIPYIFFDAEKVHIPSYRSSNGELYDKIGLSKASHIEERSKTF